MSTVRMPLASRLLCFLSLMIAFVDAPRAERLPIRNYGIGHGLPADTVSRVFRDSRGFLWFGTRVGLSRFDGHGFVNYGAKEGLPVEVIVDIAEDPAGVYWVAMWGGGGIVRFDPRSTDPARMFTPYPLGPAPAERTTALLVDRSGRVWVGTVTGLYMRDSSADPDTPFRRVELDASPEVAGGVRVHTIMEDRQQNLWVATSAGLVRRSPTGASYLQSVMPPGGGDQVTGALIEDREGRIWVAHEEGVYVFRPRNDAPAQTVIDCATRSSEEPIRLPDAPGESCLLPVGGLIGSGEPTRVLEASDGRIWIVRYTEGLTEFDGRRFHVYGEADGVSGYIVDDLDEDSAGNLWLASLDSGALRIARTGFTAYDRADGLGYTRRARPAESLNGEIAVVAGPLVYLFDGARFETLRLEVFEGIGRAGRDTPIVLHDHTGQWWLGTPRGLHRYGPAESLRRLVGRKPAQSLTAANGLPGDEITALLEDSSGDIWIGIDAAETVVRWERSTETLHRYSADQGLDLSGYPLAFAEDAAGQIWVGLPRGVARFRDGRFTTFAKDDGLIEDGVIRPYVDRSGRLWLPSAYAGVTRVDDPTVERPSFARRYTMAEGLTADPMLCAVEDLWGRIYFCTPKGVDRLEPETDRIKHYTTADGLSTSEIMYGLRDHAGALWFTSMRGVSRLEPRPDPPAPPPPPVWITGVRAAGVPFSLSGLGETEVSGLRLEAGQDPMQIDFGSLSFEVGDEIEYRYRLGGERDAWSKPSALDSIHFANLSPGRYHFEVRAVNSYGVESETPATVSFRVLPPFWRKAWFLTFVTLAVAALVFGVHRLRVARAVDLERVRTRIATDLHDDIGSSLSYVALLSEVLKRKASPEESDLGQSLGKIATTSRALMDAMSDIVWAVNPKRDRLSDLVLRMRRFANDLFTAGEIAHSFRAPAHEKELRLGPDVRREVYLVFKESVNNASRHSGCTRVEIELRADREGLTLMVRDDGRGFDPQKKSEGHGLEGMKRRAAALCGKLELDSGAGKGTRITLFAPRGRRRGLFRSTLLSVWIVTPPGFRA